MRLDWHPTGEQEYTATTPDFILVAYCDEQGEWRWLAMLADDSYEPAGDSGDATLNDTQSAMDAAAAWAALEA